MSAALDHVSKVTAFEEGVLTLLREGALNRAEYLIGEAMAASGSPALRSAASLPQGAPRITGWDQVCADLLEARQRGSGRAELVQLSLVNRDTDPGLTILCAVYEDESYSQYGTPGGQRVYGLAGATDRIRLHGLEDLIAVQRSRCPPHDSSVEDRAQWRIDTTLAGLLILIHFQRLIEQSLCDPGLPFPVAAFVTVDSAEWPMEQGVWDYGPPVSRRIASAAVEQGGMDAAAEMVAERQAERREKRQAEIIRMICEYRETYRILRMFPFYRFRARNRMADLFNDQLRIACKARDLPASGVSWRMRKPAFEAFLQRLVEALAPPSVSDALDPAHTDAFHARWLEIARAKTFNLGAQPLSLFEMNLAWALKFGGPILEYRWEEALPYRTDR